MKSRKKFHSKALHYKDAYGTVSPIHIFFSIPFQIHLPVYQKDKVESYRDKRILCCMSDSLLVYSHFPNVILFC